MAYYGKLVPIIKKFEGGYCNVAGDKGGCTNSGVTIATFRQYYGKNKTCNDLKNMTEEQWEHIFIDGYWNRWKADSINNQSLANLLVDWVYTSGVWGIKLPQRILGVKDDGIVGKKTLAAINEHPNKEFLFKQLWNRRNKQFDDIAKKNPSQKKFLAGWKRRNSELKYYD